MFSLLGEQKIKNRYKWFVNPPKILSQFTNHLSKDIHITSLTNSMLSRGSMSIIPLQAFETLNLDELKLLLSKAQPLQGGEVSETRQAPAMVGDSGPLSVDDKRVRLWFQGTRKLNEIFINIRAFLSVFHFRQHYKNVHRRENYVLWCSTKVIKPSVNGNIFQPVFTKLSLKMMQDLTMSSFTRKSIVTTLK